MKIAYLIFLIGYLIASSSHDKVIDITCNKPYEVDVSKYSTNNIPSNTDFYFRAQIEPNSKMQIEIRVLKGSIVHFNVDACAFKDRPSDMEVLTRNDKCAKGLIFKREEYSDDNVFVYYLSELEIMEGVNYLSAHMVNYYSLNYLSFNLKKIRYD